MALTRKFLKAMGIEDEKIDQIIDAHTETVDGLKESLEQAQADAKALPDVQKELNDTKEALKVAQDDGWKDKHDQVKKEFDDYKADVTAKLADRDYSDAITRAISGKKLKFSSKSAERAFTDALREKKLELKDGELTGLDDFIKEQRESDPDAFAPDNPPPRFATGSGSGGGHGAPPPQITRAAQLAAEHHASLYGGETKKE